MSDFFSLLVVILSHLSGLLIGIMTDRDDILRHGRIAHHAFVRREKSQVLEAHVPSSPDYAEASTSRAHISLPSSRRRRVSPSDTSLPPSSRRRHVSPIQAPELHESPEIPETLVPPYAPEGPRADESMPPQVFGGGSLELSLLPLYYDHTVRHVWDGEVNLVGLILFKLCLLLYYKFLTMIYFSGGL